MTEPPSSSDHEGSANAGTPRWAKVLAAIIIALVILFVVLHLAGRGIGDHGQ